MVMLLPVVGLVLSIVWGIIKGSANRRNLARAMIVINVLILGCIAAVFFLLILPVLQGNIVTIEIPFLGFNIGIMPG